MQKWEYLCLSVLEYGQYRDERLGAARVRRHISTEAVGNALGEQGWELISAEDRLWFKRQRGQEEEDSEP